MKCTVCTMVFHTMCTMHSGSFLTSWGIRGQKNLLHNPNYSSTLLMCFQVHALFDCFSVTNKCFIVHCAGFLAILHVHHLYPWQLISRCVRPREIDCDRNTIDLIQKPSRTDLRFVKKFTRPNFWPKNFTH